MEGDPGSTSVICVLQSNLTEHTFSSRAWRSEQASARLSNKAMSRWSFSTNMILYKCEIKALPLLLTIYFCPHVPRQVVRWIRKVYTDTRTLIGWFLPVAMVTWLWAKCVEERCSRWGTWFVDLHCHVSHFAFTPCQTDRRCTYFQKERNKNAHCVLVFQCSHLKTSLRCFHWHRLQTIWLTRLWVKACSVSKNSKNNRAEKHRATVHNTNSTNNSENLIFSYYSLLNAPTQVMSLTDQWYQRKRIPARITVNIGIRSLICKHLTHYRHPEKETRIPLNNSNVTLLPVFISCYWHRRCCIYTGCERTSLCSGVNKWKIKCFILKWTACYKIYHANAL